MHRLLKLAPFASVLAAHEATHALHSPLCLFNTTCLLLVAAWGVWRQRFRRTL